MCATFLMEIDIAPDMAAGSRPRRPDGWALVPVTGVDQLDTTPRMSKIMTVSLMVRVDEPRLEALYSWLQQRRGSSVQLFGWEGGKKAALLAYGDGANDDFGWASWVTKIADDPSTLLPLFDQLELVTDEAAASALNTAFVGLFQAAGR